MVFTVLLPSLFKFLQNYFGVLDLIISKQPIEYLIPQHVKFHKLLVCFLGFKNTVKIQSLFSNFYNWHLFNSYSKLCKLCLSRDYFNYVLRSWIWICNCDKWILYEHALISTCVCWNYLFYLTICWKCGDARLSCTCQLFPDLCKAT